MKALSAWQGHHAVSRDTKKHVVVHLPGTVPACLPALVVSAGANPPINKKLAEPWFFES
jgi:hypothetical protein